MTCERLRNYLIKVTVQQPTPRLKLVARIDQLCTILSAVRQDGLILTKSEQCLVMTLADTLANDLMIQRYDDTLATIRTDMFVSTLQKKLNAQIHHTSRYY